jgi:hypothetical protein
VQAGVLDDYFEPRLPPHEYYKGSYRDQIEAREGSISKVASEEGNEEADEKHQSETPEEDRQHNGHQHQRSAWSV